MTTSAMATYAYDQIDEARSELKAVSKKKVLRLVTTLSSADRPGHRRRALGTCRTWWERC